MPNDILHSVPLRYSIAIILGKNKQTDIVIYYLYFHKAAFTSSIKIHNTVFAETVMIYCWCFQELCFTLPQIGILKQHKKFKCALPRPTPHPPSFVVIHLIVFCNLARNGANIPTNEQMDRGENINSLAEVIKTRIICQSQVRSPKAER